MRVNLSKKFNCFCFLSVLIGSLFSFSEAWADFRDRPIEDEVFYFLMLDRFANGNPANDKGGEPLEKNDSRRDIMRHGYWAENEGFYHGGDLEGLTQKLDYLKNMGITAIWMSPVMKNQNVQGMGRLQDHSSGYHGYWVLDFTAVDPHLGNEQDFANLVKEAHKREMKVFIDIITNHTADLISYRECGDCPYRSVEDYPYAREYRGKELNKGFVDGDLSEQNFAKLKDSNYAYTPFQREPPGAIKKPDWLNDITLYHNRGNSTFSGESIQKGDFYGLDDLMTEHPRVVQGMIEIYKDWIAKYKIDGFRVDTVKHVNIEFWQQFVPAIKAFAKEQGVENFYIFGEVFTGNQKELAYYIREGQMDSVLDFAFHGAAKGSFADAAQAEAFKRTFSFDDIYRTHSSPQRMMTFISNHDIGRIGHFIDSQPLEETIKLKRSRLAHAALIFSRGVPVIYYGDEQGFTGHGGDKLARQDMFPSKVDVYNDNNLLGTKKTTKDDNFDSNHPLYQSIKSFTEIYHAHPGLRRGEQLNYGSGGEKLFSFLRNIPGSDIDYLVALNWDEKSSILPITGLKPEVIYPKNSKIKSNSLEVAPLDFVIIKMQRPKAELAKAPSINVLSPQENEQVAGLFSFELEAPEFSIVDFYYKLEASQQLKKIYTDYNIPYRAYVDGSTFKQGSKLTLVAKVRLPNDKTQTIERKVVVDSRPIKVKLSYENGNKRSHVLYIADNGFTSMFHEIEDNSSFNFNWPKEAKEVFVVYGSDEDSEDLEYDLPIVIDKNTISPAFKEVKGELLVDVFVNNRGEVRTQKWEKATSTKPKTLKDFKQKSAALSTPIFLRGGMNTWEANDELEEESPFVYTTKVKLSAGRVEFKIADKNWSASTNYGTPVVNNGLTSSAQSGNLSVEVEKGSEGTYRFDFIRIPSEDKTLSFLRVEAD